MDLNDFFPGLNFPAMMEDDGIVGDRLSNMSGIFYYSPIFGTDLAMPEWEAIVTLVFLSAVILTTIVGNILVSEGLILNI